MAWQSTNVSRHDCGHSLPGCKVCGHMLKPFRCIPRMAFARECKGMPDASVAIDMDPTKSLVAMVVFGFFLKNP
eukprot:4443042-Lingulodinium_polyedra.AAC.1